jgi:hypothetical protein
MHCGMYTELWIKAVEGRDHLGLLSRYEKIILKCTLGNEV